MFLEMSMMRSWTVAVAWALAAASVGFGAGERPTMSIAGEWGFGLDRGDVGVKEGWAGKAGALQEKITLPGSLQMQGYGDDVSVETKWVAALPRSDADDPGAPFVLKRWWKLPEYAAYTKPGNIKVPYLSQPVKHYLGVAWYQKEVAVPAGWDGKVVELYLERPRWGSTVWLDGKEMGRADSLVAPHEFALGTLAAGKHVVTLRLDNRMSVVPGPDAKTPSYRPDGHSVSDALGQTWNGVAGRMELRAMSVVHIDDAQVFPRVKEKAITVKVKVANAGGKAGKVKVVVGVGEKRGEAAVSWTEKGGEAEARVDLGEEAKTWDEWQRVVQTAEVELVGEGAEDAVQVPFGLREVTHEGSKLLLNGREIYLRGTHSGGDFPLTGYPATDVDTWKKQFEICKAHGLNHMRFHSWCPPEEAFTAADEVGFYLQPECGMWNNFSYPGQAERLEKETELLVKAYGNHPSFLLLSPTNEPAGAWQKVLPAWAGRWYAQDPRRLYAENSGRVNLKDEGPTYAVSAGTGQVRFRGPPGWFGKDYGEQLGEVKIPVLTHELGQWCAYPDFDLIKKFTGYLRPGNYEIYRDSAAAGGVLERNKEFAYASGKFQALCYKEEIEANLRTRQFAGFQLLDLHDYLGQGGALVGVLDPFWEEKGYISPKEWRRFCSETVPLARMKQLIYTQGETFSVEVEMAHYGEKRMKGDVAWRIEDSKGAVVKSGVWEGMEIPVGKNLRMGKVEADLSQVAAPMRYRLVVGVKGTAVENDWNFWVYPAEIHTVAQARVMMTNDWKEAKARLAEGGRVLYMPPAEEMQDDSCPPLNDVPVFWNRLMNPKLEAMLGLWVEAGHPALAQFPTDGWCDWQWAGLVKGVRAVNIGKAPKGLKPIVSAIDDWARNYKLGVLFECRVGKGRLMVSAVDLLKGGVVAGQLRASVVGYMGGEGFAPRTELTVAEADGLWPALRAKGAATKGAERGPGYLPGDVMESPATTGPGR